jgi:hypothetical protein
VLIVGGVLNLAYGILLGYPIVVIRVKGASATPRYLLATHVSSLLHAAVLLGLAWAARLSALASRPPLSSPASRRRLPGVVRHLAPRPGRPGHPRPRQDDEASTVNRHPQ